MAARTIGFFDSGQGGLTIWHEVVQRHEGINTIYLGDNARYPYGTKSAATVKRYTLEAILTLMEKGADAVVVACGTASSVAVPSLTSLFAKPVLGIVEPMCTMARDAINSLGLGPDVLGQHDPLLALLATPYTVKSGRFAQSLAAQFGSDQSPVHSVACPLLVPLVEEGFHDHTIAKQAVIHYMRDLPQSTRVILLGCTHFPRLSSVIATVAQELFGRQTCVYSAGQKVPRDAILLIDPAQAVSWMLGDVFGSQQSDPQPKDVDAHQHRIFCTDSLEGFERTARYFCQGVLPTVEQLTITI
jgi:glutamate racemase